MTRQKGIIKLDGIIGGITFYKSQDGYLAREKGGVSADRIANDPNFQRTRENGEEFGRAGKAGKLLRNSIRAMLQNASDSRMVSRFTQKMVEVVLMMACVLALCLCGEALALCRCYFCSVSYFLNGLSVVSVGLVI